MNLYEQLQGRDAPVRCAVIGCGKFSTMFLSQARHLPNMHVVAVCDLSRERAHAALARAGYAAGEITEDGIAAALRDSSTAVSESVGDLLGAEEIDVIVEATGNPVAATQHAWDALGTGHHVVMVSVEGDVLAGPRLAERARSAGLTYAMAYGDQPALICELVDWARSIGLDIVCAGKGTKYLPSYHQSTPDTVWEHYGIDSARAADAGMNPVMFNSFLDGTKSAIEMAAVANATGLTPPSDGLRFPPAGVDELASVCVPQEHGGSLESHGMVEVVSSLDRSGAQVERDLRWGVYVTVEAPSAYVANCFAEYGMVTDQTGRYTALYRPNHLIGLELPISVLSAALHGEPTGQPRELRADVATTAKRDLAVGDVLDGEGGYTVFGKLTPAPRSFDGAALPIGLSHRAVMRRPVQAGDAVGWANVDLPEDSLALRLRRELQGGGPP